MPARAVLDMSHLRAMTGDDEALQAEIVHLFRAQSELWARLLTPDAPLFTWRDAAHTLKGSARGLGLWPLAEACARAEALAGEGVKEGPQVQAELSRVRAALEEALEALECVDGAPGTPAAH